MSQKEVYEFNVPTFGPGVVFDVDHKTRAEQFRFFGDALKSSRLAAYVPQFVAEARAYFAGWGDEGVVDLKDALAELIILTASRTLMGESFFPFFSSWGGFMRKKPAPACARPQFNPAPCLSFPWPAVRFSRGGHQCAAGVGPGGGHPRLFGVFCARAGRGFSLAARVAPAAARPARLPRDGIHVTEDSLTGHARGG